MANARTERQLNRVFALIQTYGFDRDMACQRVRIEMGLTARAELALRQAHNDHMEMIDKRASELARDPFHKSQEA